MPDNLLTQKVFLWDLNLGGNSNFSTWTKEVKTVLNRNSAMHLNNILYVKSAIIEIRSSPYSKKISKTLITNAKNCPNLIKFLNSH
jgi:hypothetical protein